METILEVVTGSRLHGLNRPESDWDIRGIFLHEFMDVVSPFRKVKNTSWIEGNVDNTAYELRDFCNYAGHGNPNILEILYSNQVRKTTEIGEVLQANRKKFLDSDAIFQAYRGYAHNQYNKMNLFEPDARTPKFAVAYLRSLRQGIQLLETGELQPQVEEKDKAFLLEVKYEFDMHKHIPLLSQAFSDLQQELTKVYSTSQKLKPDIEWIEGLLLEAYDPSRQQGVVLL